MSTTILAAVTAAVHAEDDAATVRESSSRGPFHLAAWIHCDRLPWPLAVIAKTDRVIVRPAEAAIAAAIRTPDAAAIPVASADSDAVRSSAQSAIAAAVGSAFAEMLAYHAE